jgi:adenylate kinase family enzyme
MYQKINPLRGPDWILSRAYKFRLTELNNIIILEIFGFSGLLDQARLFQRSSNESGE